MAKKREYILDPPKTLAMLIGVSEYEDITQIGPTPNNVKAFAEICADKEIIGL